MPYKTDFPLLPYLDPKFDPNHPIHKIPEIKEDPYLPLGKRERVRLEKEAMQAALENYEPPHVPRSWETNELRAAQRQKIMNLVLLPKAVGEFDDLIPSSPHDSSVSKVISRTLYDPSNDPEGVDFRQFAVRRLHLGYNRFHASHGEPNLPSEEQDPNINPEDICWIMEYTYNECNTIRRKLAKVIGVFPAVTDPENQMYNDEIAWRYDRRLYVRCRRRNQHCIRPSHIEVFTSSFLVLP